MTLKKMPKHILNDSQKDAQALYSMTPKKMPKHILNDSQKDAQAYTQWFTSRYPVIYSLCDSPTDADQACCPPPVHHLVGLEARCSPSEQQTWVQFLLSQWIFFWSSHTSDLKIGTPVVTLPSIWHERVSTGTGWLGGSIQWHGEIDWSATSISVWQHEQLSEQIHPWDTPACC